MQKELIDGNLRGVFIRPDDTEESYRQKIKAIKCSALTVPCLSELYDIEAGAVVVKYQDEGLSFWEAGCTWMEEDLPWIQLKAQFETKDTLFSLYNKQEILAHEYVHAARFPLGSKKFEEFFAYKVSKCFGANFRAFLGPLFENPLDAKILIFSLLFPFVGLFFTPLYFNFFLLAPLSIIGFFLSRLFIRFNTLRRCQKNLSGVVKYPLHLMVRMTDDEIETISKMRASRVYAFLEEKSQLSFRWNFLFQCYVRNNFNKEFSCQG